jgi:signal transduction histidine kinase
MQVVLPVLILQVGGMFLLAGHAHMQRKGLDGLGVALLAASPLALAGRDRAPRLVLAAVLLLTGAYYLLGYPYGPAFIALIAALYAAVMRGQHRFAWGATAVALLAYIGLDRLIGWGPEPTVTDYMAIVAWLAVVLLGSEAMRWRAQRRQQAEWARQEEVRRRASEERLRMAQELHDVLGHNISLINVRAGIALHLIDERPDEARAALEAIKTASKDALAELRTALGILRQDGAVAPRAPAPGIDQLERLVADAASSGLSIRMDVCGDVRPLPPAVDLAAFRIGQEAITNVLRHSHATSARIGVEYQDEAVVLTVEDRGTADPGMVPQAGSGILGMRERAAAVGGSLIAQPRRIGGFEVIARLPYGGEP